MLNRDKLVYTYEHRQAVNYVAEKILTPLGYAMEYDRFRFHDLDKSLLNTIVPDRKLVSIYHKRSAIHHLNPTHDNYIVRMDMIECIIDLEAEGYTKPDKPYNAYDTICSAEYFSEERKAELLKILEQYNMNSSYRNTPDDPDWMEYKKRLVPVSDEAIMSEIYTYIFGKRNNVLKNLILKYHIDNVTSESVTDAIKKELVLYRIDD